MILDLDIGNTRIKWRLTGDGQAQASGSTATKVGLAGVAPSTDLVERVRVASVVGSLRAEVEHWAWARWQVAPEFAVVIDGAGGVRCGYTDADQLGVDRWLITVAAWQRCRRPLVVVSAGTALTVDMVDGGGRHLGGYILPGLRLMASSLGVSTWGVRVESRDKASLAPGRSTVEAVSHGALTGAIGVIRQALAVSGARVLYLTGGDASVLMPWLEADTETWQAPDMVMEGLEIVLPRKEQPL